MTKRILVIEDTEDNRQIIGDLLNSAGYELIEAVDGLEGVATAEREQPDLILMDIQLPGIDGIEALRRIRAERALDRVPVLAVSASVMPDDQRKIVGSGFDAFVGKPIDLKQFLATVQRFLAGGRAAP
jgi:two-component system, cell cycle response regulator DivK